VREWNLVPGETPIDTSGMKLKGIGSRSVLNGFEAENLRKAVVKFLNGNGRWARLLSNIWLIRHDHPLTEWPEETIGDRSVIRDEYIVAIKSADNGVEAPLIELHSRYTRLET
jgi:hypothetical protein